MLNVNNSQIRIRIALGVGVVLVALLAPVRQLGFVGISHCGRVFSDISVEERNIISFLSVTGDLSRFRIVDGSELDKVRKSIPENIDVIWTIGVNNSGCFSYSQKAYISQFQERTFIQTIYRDAGLSGCGNGICYTDFYTGNYTQVKEK